MATERHRAPAKINLILRVGPRRSDGYHQVASLIARVALADEIIVTPAARTTVTCPALPGGDTLVTRALARLKEEAGHDGGWRVRINKRIPAGAGLGGGSSDAATALRAANATLEKPLTAHVLASLAAEIGSDVPFFLGPSVAVVRGRGDIISPAPHVPPCAVAIAHPGRPLATRDVYDAYVPAGGLDDAFSDAPTLTDLAVMIENSLAPIAERLEPACADLHRVLVERRALAASVSGSGSAVFGLFHTVREAEDAIRDLPGAAWTVATRIEVS